MCKIDLTKVKLIVWDLDDTFWKGILSEETISPIEKNCNIIKEATDAGIINSICSKNDFEQVKNRLEQDGLWGYFIYPSINWESKGFRVKEQIESLQLRPANVLFIDDNNGNINEVKYYNPEIMTAKPEDLDYIYDEVCRLEKKDKEHSRLKRYKILEAKIEKRKLSGTNLEFLKSCNIQLLIKKDCTENIDRIHELLLRTNQLNFTKNRIPKEELIDILNNPKISCGYVEVNDDFGDYGIVGFYALAENRLEHFLFSCRCLGMGVEQYVYAHLNFPDIDIQGETAVKLDKKTVPEWINSQNKVNHYKKRVSFSNCKILLKGPCDMSQIFSFINESENMDCEFTYMSEKGVSIEQHNHTQCILQSLQIGEERKKEIMSEIPFADKDMYTQKMFKNKYDIIFFSLFTDGGLGVYKRKETGEYIAFSEYIHPLTDEKEWEGYLSGEISSSRCTFKKEDLKTIKEKYKYVGRLSPNQIVDNIKQIYANLDKLTILVLLLGSEKPYPNNENANYNDRHIFNKELNDKIKKLASENANIKYIDFNEFITSSDDFYNNINHFMKPVYYRMSKKMTQMINELAGTNYSSSFSVKIFIDYCKQHLKKFFRGLGISK